MKLSSNIRQLRREKSMSQEQLADALEVSRQAVSRWESGDSTPEIDKLVKMSELFEVSLDGLVRDAIHETSGVGLPVDKATFDRKYRQFAMAISGGVGLVIIGLGLTLSFWDGGNGWGEIFLLSALLLAALIVARYGMILSAVRRTARVDMDEIYTARDEALYARSYAQQCMLGVMLWISGFILTIVMSMFSANEPEMIFDDGAQMTLVEGSQGVPWATVAMFMLIAAGSTLIIRARILRGRFTHASPRAGSRGSLVIKILLVLVLLVVLVNLLQ